MRQLETQLFALLYNELAYVFEASFSTLVTWVSKKIKRRTIRTREIAGVRM